jgi:bifunctional DNA-binding transcriptional regulator/antitoxin component of YhaV-PrlF toxin-antitoxin module
MISGIAQVVPDPSDVDQYLLELPPEILERLGWQEGDALLWQIQSDGVCSLSKKSS